MRKKKKETVGEKIQKNEGKRERVKEKYRKVENRNN